MKHFTIALLLFFAVQATFSQSFNLNVPNDHPRLYWDSTSLAIAKNWYLSNNFLVNAGYDSLTIHDGRRAVDYALKYVLSEGITDSNTRHIYARNAIEWAMLALTEIQSAPFDTMTQSGTCDECRWHAENMMMVVDWCYDELYAGEWNDFYNSLNQLIPMWNTANWGNPNMVANNYNHGYARQSILWALMIYHEDNSLANNLLQDAINLRWSNFLNYASTKGIGGIPSEGTSYGSAILGYHLVAGKSMENAGYDYLGQTAYFKNAIAHTIYNTTPAPSYIGPNETAKYVLPYPYGDAAAFMDVSPWDEPLDNAYSSFMLLMAYKYQGVGDLPKYAKNWVETHDRYGVYKPPPRYVRSITDQLSTKSIANNPLDYFSPDGGGMLPYGYARTSWTDSTASSLFVQMGKPPYDGHEHQDAGSFTMAKGDRFLVIPPTGRGYGSGWKIPDYNGLPSSGVDVQRSIAKNTILFGKEGSAFDGETTSTIDRLQHDPEFFYVANDLTDTYKNPSDPNNPNSNNEHCESFVREVVFIRKLETAIVFDRTKSVITEDQTKTSLVHVQNQPSITAADEYTVVNGDYSAVIHTLLPVQKTIDIIDERVVTGETPRDDEAFRLQIENNESGVVYFLNVIQVMANSEANVVVNLIDTGNTFTIVLTHPSKGNAVVQFEKGQFSTGGSISCHPTVIQTTLDPLNELAQGITVTDDGPEWSTLPAAIFNDFNKDDNSCDLQVYEDVSGKLKINSESIRSAALKVKIYDLGGKLVANEIVQLIDGVGFINSPNLTSTDVYVMEYRSKECFGAIKLLKR